MSGYFVTLFCTPEKERRENDQFNCIAADSSRSSRSVSEFQSPIDFSCELGISNIIEAAVGCRCVENRLYDETRGETGTFLARDRKETSGRHSSKRRFAEAVEGTQPLQRARLFCSRKLSRWYCKMFASCPKYSYLRTAWPRVVSRTSIFFVSV